MSRAQVSVTVYFRIFEIILLVMVIGIVATEIKNAEKGGTYDKKFFSRDIALIMDSLTNARGNVIYIYNPPNADLNRFEIDFSNNAVNVGGDQWQYAVNKNLKLTAPLKGKYPTLAIKKSGNNLWVEQGGPRETLINGYLLECPAANLVVDSLIIDPGHGFNPITNDGSRGFAGEPKDAKGRQVPESELVLKISAALQSQASIKGITKVIGTRSLDTNIISLPNLGDFIAEENKNTGERVALIRQNPLFAVVSLHIGKYAKTQNVVKAFVNKDAGIETQKLACSILNAIADKYGLKLTGTAIIPVDVSKLAPDDPKQVLVKGSNAVLLEIGNINYPNNELFTDLGGLAFAITDGITKV